MAFEDDAAIKTNLGGIKHAEEATVSNRNEVNGTGNCFITLKYHKTNFINHSITRLINPAKSEIGRISKEMLDKISSVMQQIKSKRMEKHKQCNNMVQKHYR